VNVTSRIVSTLGDQVPVDLVADPTMHSNDGDTRLIIAGNARNEMDDYRCELYAFSWKKRVILGSIFTKSNHLKNIQGLAFVNHNVLVATLHDGLHLIDVGSGENTQLSSLNHPHRSMSSVIVDFRERMVYVRAGMMSAHEYHTPEDYSSIHRIELPPYLPLL